MTSVLHKAIFIIQKGWKTKMTYQILTLKGKNFRHAALAAVMTLIMLISSIFCTMEVNADGGINWGTAVPITQNGQVVDSITMNGKTVQAIYAPRGNVANYDSDTTYCCAAFVKRFYNSVYGVDVWNLNPGNTPSAGSGYFYKVDTPQPGDIAANSGHWAIVKSNSNGAVGVIEQNAWNTKYTSAMVGRTLYSGSGYWYWRWSGAGSSASSSGSSSQNSNPGFSFSLNPVQTGSNNAVIKTTVSNPSRINVTQVGCYIYDANGRQIKRHTESCQRSESTFYIWYDIAAELGITLSSRTTYQYKIFVVYNGYEYQTQTGSFTTN